MYTTVHTNRSWSPVKAYPPWFNSLRNVCISIFVAFPPHGILIVYGSANCFVSPQSGLAHHDLSHQLTAPRLRPPLLTRSSCIFLVVGVKRIREDECLGEHESWREWQSFEGPEAQKRPQPAATSEAGEIYLFSLVSME